MMSVHILSYLNWHSESPQQIMHSTFGTNKKLSIQTNPAPSP
jgi:hypothetical protein